MRSFKILGIAALCTSLFSAACGDSASATVAASDAGADQAVATEVKPQASDALTLTVRSLDPATPLAAGNRLVVVWSHLSDDGPDPAPRIAYDAPFDPAAGSIVIPDGAIAVPDEPNITCKRACNDESKCACEADSPLRVAFGYVMVLKDSKLDPNGDGRTDVRELFAETNVVGLADLVPLYSDATVPNASAFIQALSGGVEQGIKPMAVERRDAGFDRLVKPTATTFELKVCPPTQGCIPDFFNLT